MKKILNIFRNKNKSLFQKIREKKILEDTAAEFQTGEMKPNQKSRQVKWWEFMNTPV